MHVIISFMDLEFITKHEGYEYAAMTFATICLFPQIWSGYRSGSLKDMSAASQWLILFASLLWAIYMYDNNYITYMFVTFIVTGSSLTLLCMKFYYYQKRVNNHFRSFDQQPPTLSIMTTSNGEENHA